MKKYSLLFLCCCLSVFLFAQDKAIDLGEIAEKAAKELSANNTEMDSLAKLIGNAKKLNRNNDSLVNLRYDEALVAFFEYQTSGFQHRRSVFQWQHYSTIIIFFVVIFLVLSGLYFSWLQFQKGMKAEGEGALPETEVELSMSNIKVRSSIVGIVILVVSLAFFYLYLVYIYPINELF